MQKTAVQTLWVMVVIGLVGCGGSALDGDGSPGSRLAPEIDNDELFGGLYCPSDPDCFTSGSCQVECPDYWVCETLPGKDHERCANPGPDFPDSSGDWVCQDLGDRLVCEGDSMPADGGGSSWVCVEDDGHVTCTNDSPSYPGGGGGDDWNCWYEDEFRYCEPDSPTDGDSPPTDGDSQPADGDTAPTGTDYPDWPGSICFYPEGDSSAPPIVSGSFGFETHSGRDAVHVVLVFAEGFVDNTYGANSSDGYRGGPNGHTFRDLVSSDHAEVGFVDGAGSEVLLAKFDYIDSAGTASGYDALGVSGGDGSMLNGDASAVLDATSSLARNLNELGCVYTQDSPTAEQCPGWENRVIYETWLDLEAFGSAGFGNPMLTFVHASPSRTTDTIPVQPGPCP